MLYNIMIVGVGGQGTLLASRILGKYAELKKFDCKLSEVHGMAQRGGSVVTYVRMGDEKINSPIIAAKTADIILAFEKLEAARWASELKDNGILVVNDQEINPMPVTIGKTSYPHNALEDLKKVKIIKVPALDIAIECGSPKAVNTVILGVLCKYLELDFDVMQKALELCVKEKFVELNKKAFLTGYGYQM